jgi:hypothetical protein
MLHHLADCLRGYPHEIPPVGSSGTAKYKVQRYRYKVPMLWVCSDTDKHKVRNKVLYQCYGYVQEHLNIRYQCYGFPQVQRNIRYNGTGVSSGTAKYKVQRYKVLMLGVRSGTDKHKVQRYEVSYRCYGLVQVQPNIGTTVRGILIYGFVQVQLIIRPNGARIQY